MDIIKILKVCKNDKLLFNPQANSIQLYERKESWGQDLVSERSKHSNLIE